MKWIQAVSGVMLIVTGTLTSLAIAHELLSQPASSPSVNITMPTVIIREPLTLQAGEEDPRFPPLGVEPDPNRPISYALLNVTFENKTLNRIEVIINSVEIRSSQTNTVLNSLPARTLTLMPLEVSAQQYRMYSRQSYGEHRRLIGTLTYTIDGQTYTLTTPETAVQ
ncbi:MAG: hypothetical protein Q6J44_03215 [Gloeomargarita sp. DG02_4_bins_56]